MNTGGGDAPGLNAVIRAVALSAHSRGWEVWGIRYGYRGLIEDPGADSSDGVFKLDRDAVRGIMHQGGSILGAASRNDPFNYPMMKNGHRVPTDVSSRLVKRFRKLGFDALVAIGGDGSIKLARRLLECGLPRVIAVPKTIDNDLPGTDVTFGFATAVATATDAIDKIHTTAQSHERVMVVEVMGRYAGWIALEAGIAGGADVVLIPEIPYDLDRVCEKIRRREEIGRHFSIVVVAEGARPIGGGMVFQGGKDAFHEHARLGGIAEVLARQLADRTGKETRSLVLGHLQRGGGPVMSDRVLAQELGCAATRFLAETDLSGMVSVRGQHIELVGLEEATQGLRTVPLDSDLLSTARDLGLCFGDEEPGALLHSLRAPPSSAT